MKYGRQRGIKKIRDFRVKLLRWYSGKRRILPWRENPTPYRVWISEIMLQQTQVKTVLPYYDRFLKRFPDVESLARSSEQQVLKHWAGLGYYSRARNLHKAAKLILKRHGAFPTDYDSILALPGVGRYTAGAICSIAFDLPKPVVDGNIRRVLVRLDAIRGHVPERCFWDLMTQRLPEKNVSSFNQAMMELGALVCVPAQPHCSHCPVSGFCEAWRLGIQSSIPETRIKQAVKPLSLVVLILKQNNKVLISRSAKPQFIPGKWGLPCRILSGEESAEKAASSLCASTLGRKVPLTRFAMIRHSISNYRITAHGFCAREMHPTKDLRGAGGCCWIPASSSARLLTSSLFHKLIKEYSNKTAGE